MPNSAVSTAAPTVKRAVTVRRAAVTGILLLASILAGCGGTGSVSQDPSPVSTARGINSESALADRLYDQGQFASAAAEYEAAAAGAAKGSAGRLRTLAANAHFSAGNTARAEELLTSVDPADPLARTVAARIALARGDNPDAVLASLPGRLSGDRDSLLLSLTNASALEAAGRTLDAATLRVSLDDQLELNSPSAAAENRRATWRALGRTPSVDIEVAGSANNALSGWLALAVLARKNAEPAAFATAINGWRGEYPGHPANLEVVPDLALAIESSGTLPQTVGLMLPLSGRFATAAGAVRDGFLAAAEIDFPGAERRRVLVRDTSDGNVASHYRDLVAQGAGMVVGPLRRGAVAQLLESGAITVPTVLLNQSALSTAGVGAGGVEGATTVEFALSPESEAAEVARRAFADGHRRAAVMVPEGAWGERVSAGFVDAWRAAGGAVTFSRSYPVDPGALSVSIADALDIDGVEKRARAVSRAAQRKLDFVPQPRGDVDAVLLAAYPVEARQIMPLLLFHRADAIAVYATSHANAELGEEETRDLDRLVFGDMPWIVTPGNSDPLLRQRMQQTQGDAGPQFRRLFAFGADALRLGARLEYLVAQPGARFEGETGTLSVDDSGAVQRELRFARFDNGAVAPLPGASAAN